MPTCLAKDEWMVFWIQWAAGRPRLRAELPLYAKREHQEVFPVKKLYPFQNLIVINQKQKGLSKLEENIQTY